MKIRHIATTALIAVTAAVFSRPSKQARRTAAVQPAEQAPVVEATPVVELAPLAAEDVKGEMPSEAEIVEAAKSYESARLAKNAAERALNKAKRILGRTPDGIYGRLTVERRVSTRKVVDLDEVRRIFAENGLGEVPMKACAPSLAFDWAAEQEAAELLAA